MLNSSTLAGDADHALTRDDYLRERDLLPIFVIVNPLSVAGLTTARMLCGLLIEAEDKVDLLEWMKSSHADEMQSLAIKPKDWGEFDSEPFGPGLFYVQALGSAVWMSQFMRQFSGRSRRGQAGVEADSYGVYGVPTSRRKREEDERRPEMRRLACVGMRNRELAFCGTRLSGTMAAAPRDLNAGPLVGTFNLMEQNVPYSLPEDYYLEAPLQTGMLGIILVTRRSYLS